MHVSPPPLRVTPSASAAADASATVPLAPLVPVLLSGGASTNLWPLSRDSHPQQFMPLASSRSLLQEAALRAAVTRLPGLSFAAPLVVCHHEHRFLVAAQMQECGLRDARILLEPAARGSLAAMAASALLVAEENPDAVLWMVTDDALVGDVDALHRLLRPAIEAANEGHIVAFGLPPRDGQASHGCLEPGESILGVPGVHGIARFAENSASESHRWNSGLYVVKAKTLLDELRRHAPGNLNSVMAAVAQRQQDLDFQRLAPAYLDCPSICLDEALGWMLPIAAVIPADLPWFEADGWKGIWQAGPQDPQGNVAVGDAVLEGAERCYVHSEGILTAVVGLQDAAVVVTRDAVLAMHRDQTHRVDTVLRQLRAAGRKEAAAHTRCHRPWGFYESLILADRFQVKRIVVNPGCKLSLQKHFHRDEHWVVVQGSALVTRDAEEFLVPENESVYLPLGCVHRLKNPGRIPLTLIEVQLGRYLGEDDIIRLEDDYARL